MIVLVEYTDGRIHSYDTSHVAEPSGQSTGESTPIVECILRADLLFSGRGLRVDYVHNTGNRNACEEHDLSGDKPVPVTHKKALLMDWIVEPEDTENVALVDLYDAGSVRSIAFRMAGELIDARAVDRAEALLGARGHTERIDTCAQVMASMEGETVDSACAAVGVTLSAWKWAHRAHMERAKLEEAARAEAQEAVADGPDRPAMAGADKDSGSGESAPQNGSGEATEGTQDTTVASQETDPYAVSVEHPDAGDAADGAQGLTQEELEAALAEELEATESADYDEEYDANCPDESDYESDYESTEPEDEWGNEAGDEEDYEDDYGDEEEANVDALAADLPDEAEICGTSFDDADEDTDDPGDEEDDDRDPEGRADGGPAPAPDISVDALLGL